MVFSETPLQGAFVLRPEIAEDSRGFFARTYCRREFEAHGLEHDFVQCSVSFNRAAGTLRGLHHQTSPYEEAKLVRCTMGSIFDVIVDLRPESRTFRKWFGLELNAQNRLALYIPRGFAHGFQTTLPDSEIYYQMTEYYHPECASGVRWDDPGINIRWPRPISAISERDRTLGYLSTSR